MKGSTPRKLTGPLRFAKAIGAAPLSRSHKALLNAYVERVNYQTWEAWPGVRDLAERSGIGRRTVQIGIKALAEMGVLSFVYKSKGGIGQNGKGLPHRVVVNIEVLEALYGADEHPLAPQGMSRSTAQNQTDKGAEQTAKGADQIHKQTIHPSDQKYEQTIYRTPGPAATRTPPIANPDGSSHSQGRDGWMAKAGNDNIDDAPPDLRGTLKALGVRGANLESLTAATGLTIERVRDEWLRISEDANVRSKAAVLVKTLAGETGTVLSLKNRLRPDARQTISAIEELRRNRRSGGIPKQPSGAWD